jgi:hypothetical protein
LPKGGWRSFAHLAPPEVVLVRMGRGLPWDLSVAFASPVDPRGEDPALASAKRLLSRWQAFEKRYGPAKDEWKKGVSVFDLAFPLAENFSDLVEEAVAWAAKL